MRSRIHSILATIILILLVGCSSGHQSAVAPDLTQPAPADLNGSVERSSAGSNHNVFWGIWDVHIEPMSGTVEIVPLRSAQWTLDMTKFLQPPIGPSGAIGVAVVDNSEWLSAGRLQLDVSITHPFPGLPQFTGSDARGVLITIGHNAAIHNPDLIYSDAGVNDPYLANADGYTRWMNPVEFPDDGTIWTFTEGNLGTGTGFDATLNPYKYFTDTLDTTENLYDFFSEESNLANRGQFIPSQINTRRYDIYFPLTGPGGLPSVNFQYAVLASWRQATDLDPGDLPGSFPPDANTHEAFLVNAVDAGTLFYTESVAGGDLVLELEIFDWAPYLGASGSVIDEIERIFIEGPLGILPAPYIEFTASDLASNYSLGTTDASSIVTIEITGCLPTDVENQQVLIGIEQAGQTYDNYGYGTVYPEGALTAYFFHTLEVSAFIPQEFLPIVIEIDPNQGMVGEYLANVNVTGENLSEVTELKLVGDFEQTTALNLVVVDDEHLTSDLDLTGLSIGLYDVVAHDPNYGDGILVDGFQVLEIIDAVIVTAIEPDHGIPDTYQYDVMVTGQNFSGVTIVKLIGDTEESTALNLDIIDSQHIMCELDLTGLSLGLYDVVAIDPNPDIDDGILVDGFVVMDCPLGIHDNFTLYTATPAFDPLFVAGLLTSGSYAGQVVTQDGMPDWVRIDTADPPTDDTPVYFYANKPSVSAMYYDWSWSMDMDPVNEVFAFSTFDDDDDSGSWPDTQFDFVKICNQEDGSYLGACDTNCGYIVAQVDIDEYGNVWAVCGNAYYPNFGYTLQRWDYDPDAPAPHYTFIAEWDLSTVINGDQVISDIVVLQRYRRLFISTSSSGPWGVEIHSWDFSTDPPTYLGDTFTTQAGFYGTNSFQEAHQRFVDMEVDRTDDVLAACRILVMYMGRPGELRTMELRKYDLDLNLLAESSHEFDYEYDYNGNIFKMWFSNFVLDDMHDGRVIALYDNFGMPPPGHIGVAEAPIDW